MDEIDGVLYLNPGSAGPEAVSPAGYRGRSSPWRGVGPRARIVRSWARRPAPAVDLRGPNGLPFRPSPRRSTLERPVLELEPGKKLPHYQILETLGRGGQAFVYRAWDQRLKRDVAIKVPKDGRSGRLVDPRASAAASLRPLVREPSQRGCDLRLRAEQQAPSSSPWSTSLGSRWADRIRSGPVFRCRSPSSSVSRSRRGSRRRIRPAWFIAISSPATSDS